jgi:SNF2 family DNA or RNA helicase
MTSVASLWPHQQQAVERARIKPHLALLFEMGTGKTRTLIEILREDYNGHKRIRPTLIFAPLSVCAQWKSEFAKFSKVSQDFIHVLTGDGKRRERALRGIIERGSQGIVVTNYEAVGIKGFYSALLDWSPRIVVADEGHRLKNSGSERAKKIYPLSMTADRRFILTGTLFTNSLLDIYGPFKFMDPAIFGPSYWKFRQTYFYDKNAKMPAHIHFPDWQPLPDAKDRISKVLAETSLQAKKDQCLSLPPLVRSVIPITLSGYQKKCYEMMERECVAELNGKTVIAEFAMTVTLRLRQVLAGFLSGAAGDKVEYFDDNPRIKALEDIVDGIGKEKCIVWSNFSPSYPQIGEALEKLSVKYASLTGEQTAREKQEAITAFKDGDTQVLISNPGAGGVGLNFAEAPYSIFFDKSYNLEHYLQASARNHRAGSERFSKITHYTLQATGTIDEAIEAALNVKEDLGRAVLSWAREKALEQAKNNGYAPAYG